MQETASRITNTKHRYNLDSPNQILAFDDFETQEQWLQAELSRIDDQPISHVMHKICENLDTFIKWPEIAYLLWDGCTRKNNRIYHRIPSRNKSSHT
jgi:hypothetical protein